MFTTYCQWLSSIQTNQLLHVLFHVLYLGMHPVYLQGVKLPTKAHVTMGDPGNLVKGLSAEQSSSFRLLA